MKTIDVTVVRIYINEGDAMLKSLLKRLHDWEKVRGVTVFRGVTGFGQTGPTHTSAAVDLSLNLPLVVEFFDEPEKVNAILDHLNTTIKPGHMVSWSARVNETL